MYRAEALIRVRRGQTRIAEIASANFNNDANDRYKMAGRWFALPKLFRGARSHGYQVVTNDRDLIQFRYEEVSDYFGMSCPWIEFMVV